MFDDRSRLQEKADQVLGILDETGIDCWLTFVRETSVHPDPGIEMVVGADVVRNSAFLMARDGTRIALVANFDTAAVRQQGVFTDVRGYDEDLRGLLITALDELRPETIGLNFSRDDQTADGLTYGQRLLLEEWLTDTPYRDRLISAQPFLARLRARKSPEELARIRRAVALAEEVVMRLEVWLRPGVSEAEVASFVQAEIAALGGAPAWSTDSCPIVNAGPDSDFGHAAPNPRLCWQPGQLLHVDLGVRWQGYCSDLQRTWYLGRPDELTPPAEVLRAAEAVARAIDAAAAELRPGVVGRTVDAAARASIVADGYPEFPHAVGHALGRAVHDGGTLLGPPWPCYGATVEQTVEAGNVYTLELGVLSSAGCYGLEEDLLVTDTGFEFLSDYRRDIRFVPFAGE